MTVDYAALAKQYGGTSAPPPTSPAPSSQGVDYAALAKQYGGTSQPAQIPEAPQAPAPQGFIDRLRSAYDKRGENVQKAKDAYAKGEQGLGRTIFQAGGQFVGAGFDTLTAAVPNSVKSYLSKDPYVQNLIKPVQQGVTAASNKLADTPLFREAAAASNELPIERDIKAFQEYLNLLPGPKGLKVAGAVTEPVRGAVSSTVSRGVQTATAGIKDRAVNSIEQAYRDIGGATSPPRKILAKADARGKDPARFLAERNIVPEIKDGKVQSVAQADALHTSTDPLNQHLDLALKEAQSGVPKIDIETMRQDALKRADALDMTEAARKQVKSHINEELDLQKEKHGDQLDLIDVNGIKRVNWKATKFDATKPYIGDANYLVGKSAQQAIEKAVPKELPIHELNSHIGDIYEAEKFLRSLEGRAVKGGRLGRYFGRVVGAAIGSSHGPLGTFFGTMGGDAVVQVLQSATFSNPLKQLILKNLKQSNSEAYQKVLDYMKKSGMERDTRPLLPPASSIITPEPKGRVTPVDQFQFKQAAQGKLPPEYTIGDYLRPKR